MEIYNPLISIIVPIYNVERYLDQALESLRTQTYANLEIICINDGSTDDSPRIIAQHAAEDDRIVVIDKANAGYGAGCNDGLRAAHGDWVGILEPDDWILPDMYASMLEGALQYVGAGSGVDAVDLDIARAIDIIKTPYVRICMPDTPQEKHLACSYKGRVKPRRQPFRLAEAPHLFRHHPSIWSALYSRAFLQRHSIAFHEVPGAGWVDNPFFAETLLKAKSIVYVDRAFYCYREETPEKEAAFNTKNATIPLERWNEMQDVIDEIRTSNNPLHSTGKKNLTDAVMRMQVERAFVYLNGLVNAGVLDLSAIAGTATAEAKDANVCLMSEIAAEDSAVFGETVDPKLAMLLRKTFNRIDPQYVLTNAAISPDAKMLYCAARGIAPDAVLFKGRKAFLVSEGLYNLKNNGIKYTFSMVLKVAPGARRVQ